MTAKTLLRGGCVLTMGRTNFLEADVLIEGETISEIGEGLRARDAEVIEAAGTIVMPGFVDAHRHVWHSLFKNQGDSTPANAHGPSFSPDDVYAAELIGMLGAIDSGITTVVDWFDVGAGEGHLEAAIQAHADSGCRSVIAHARAPWAEGNDDWRDDLRRLDRRAKPGPLLTFAAGAPTPRPDGLDAVGADWALARQLGLRIHTHVGTSREAPSVGLDSLAAKGLLGEDVTLVQGTHLSDADFDLVSSTGTMVALTPVSAMSDGVGRPPVQKLIDRGIRPGLGVGTEQLSPGDIFAQMRAAISVQHATLFDLKLAGKGGIPNLLNTREVLKYATIDGARAAGVADAVGSLAPGRKADLIVLRADRPNIFPINDPIGAVVWGMDTSNVDWVFVAGRALKQAGELQGDLSRAGDLAVAARERLIGDSGRLAGVASGGAG